jgi:hypothetical protein
MHGVTRYGLDTTGTELGKGMGCCKYDNEPLGVIRDG